VPSASNDRHLPDPGTTCAKVLEYRAHDGVQHEVNTGHDANHAHTVFGQPEPSVKGDQAGRRRRVDAITRP